jgi:hypothetical protein
MQDPGRAGGGSGHVCAELNPAAQASPRELDGPKVVIEGKAGVKPGGLWKSLARSTPATGSTTTSSFMST